MCEIDIFGMKHRSAEHAYQYVKAMRSGDVARANLIKDSRTALDAKKRLENSLLQTLNLRSKGKPL